MWVASLCQPAVQGAASVKDIQIRAVVEEIAKAYLAECGGLTGDALTPFLESLLTHLPFVTRISPRTANAVRGGRTNSLYCLGCTSMVDSLVCQLQPFACLAWCSFSTGRSSASCRQMQLGPLCRMPRSVHTETAAAQRHLT